MLKYQDFQRYPAYLYTYEKQNKNLLIRAVGSVCKPVGMLNRSAGSG